MARTVFVLLATLLHIATTDKTVTETYTVTYTYTFTATPTTATLTPFDSFASSSGDTSHDAAASDKSLLSGSSDDVTGSSGSDYSDSNARSGELSGFNASGSSGSYLHVWQWFTLIFMCCICHCLLVGCIGVAADQNQRKRKSKPRPPVKERPLPPPLQETPRPQMGVPPVPQMVSTTLTAEAITGSQQLQVASQAGFEIGKEVVIDQGHLTEEVSVIAGFGSLILATPLKYPHGPGATVTQLHGQALPVQAMSQEKLASVEAGAERALNDLETQALLSGAPPPIGDVPPPIPAQAIVPGVSFEEEHGFGMPQLFGDLPPLTPLFNYGQSAPITTSSTPITTYSSATSVRIPGGSYTAPASIPGGSYTAPATYAAGSTYAAPSTYAARPTTYTAGSTYSAYGLGSRVTTATPSYSVGGLSAGGIV